MEARNHCHPTAKECFCSEFKVGSGVGVNTVFVHFTSGREIPKTLDPGLSIKNNKPKSRPQVTVRALLNLPCQSHVEISGAGAACASRIGSANFEAHHRADRLRALLILLTHSYRCILHHRELCDLWQQQSLQSRSLCRRRGQPSYTDNNSTPGLMERLRKKRQLRL